MLHGLGRGQSFGSGFRGERPAVDLVVNATSREASIDELLPVGAHRVQGFAASVGFVELARLFSERHAVRADAAGGDEHMSVRVALVAMSVGSVKREGDAAAVPRVESLRELLDGGTLRVER